MIVTVTPNAAIDRTLSVPNFRLGRRHRSVETTSMAGGKGVNVSRALRNLGLPVIATGLTGGPTGTLIAELLSAEGIVNDFTSVAEESRTSTAVLDPASGEQTEINERGPAVSEAELERFVEKLLYLLRGASQCVFAGSLPRGIDAGVYGRLMGEARRAGVTGVLDVDGEPLRQAVRAEPDLVTPNELEAEELVGHEFADEDDRLAALREIAELGAREVIMTRATGAVALLAHAGGSVLCRASLERQEEPVSTVGSGDAFLAGFVAGRHDGAEAVECLRLAVAAGAESTRHLGAGVLDRRGVERLAPEVEVEVISEPALDAG